MKGKVFLLILGLLFWSLTLIGGAGDFMVSHQGVVKQKGVPVNANCEFRFAIIDAQAHILWSNDGSHIGDSADSIKPDASVTLTVKDGRYSVKLGDTSMTNMTSLSPNIFLANPVTYLRIWFTPPGGSPQRLQPDLQLVGVPYAAVAETARTVQPGSVTAESMGRASNVWSFYFEDTVGATNKLLFSVPDDKTLVITDIVVVYSQIGPEWGFRDANSTSKTYLKYKIDATDSELYNLHISLNSGILIESGKEVYLRNDKSTTSYEIHLFLSGYMF